MDTKGGGGVPTMLEMLEDGKEYSQGASVSAKGGAGFTTSLTQWTTKVVSDFLRYRTDLNMAIAKIAQANNLNNEQIQRIIEEVNTQVYLTEYNRQRSSFNRAVEFEVASLQKIKDLMGNDTKANTETPVDPATKWEKPRMAKKASVEPTSGGDKLNFFNYTSHEMSNLSEDKKMSKRTLIEREVTEKLAAAQESYDRSVRNFTTDVYCLADAFVQLERKGGSTQATFEIMCKEAALTKKQQLMVKEAVEQRAAQLKARRELPEMFSCELQLVEGQAKVAKLSLGEHSLIKTASPLSSNKLLPTIITDKAVFRDIASFIKVASSIKEQQECLVKSCHRQKKLQKMLQEPAQ